MALTARLYLFPTPSEREGRQSRARRSPLRDSAASRKRRRLVSHEVVDWVWEQSVRGVQQHVLLAIARRHNHKTGQCNPTAERLAKDTGLGDSTIRRAIRELNLANLILVSGKDGGRSQAPSYIFPFSKAKIEDRPFRRSIRFGNTPLEERFMAAGAAWSDDLLVPGEGVAEAPKVSRRGSKRVAERDPSGGERVSERAEKGVREADAVLRTGTREAEPGREADAAAPPTPDTDGLFDEPVTPASINRARVKVAQAIAARYCELEPMSKYVNVLGIVRRPLESDRFSGEMVMAAVERIAKEHRTLTLETLRVELVGFTPRTNGAHRDGRVPLRERLAKGGAA